MRKPERENLLDQAATLADARSKGHLAVTGTTDNRHLHQHIAASLHDLAEEIRAMKCRAPAEPAEPDSGAPELKVGEYYYCDTGGRVHHKGKVRLDQLYPERGEARVWCEATADCWFVPVAALHREGSQSPPPDKGAVFLGRDREFGCDCWWHRGYIYITFNATFNRYSPNEIESGSVLAGALAVARELGLPEAEKDEPAPEPEQQDKFDLGDPVLMPAGTCGTIVRVCGRAGRYDVDVGCPGSLVIHKDVCECRLRSAPEPEHPEPKFAEGQWVEREHPRCKFRIDKIAWDSDTWRYSGNKANGSRHVDAREADLASCAPVLTPEQEALRPGDVVESIEIPVGADGVPRGEPRGADTIAQTTRRLTRPDFAWFPDRRTERLWNLRLARKPDA